MCRTVADEDAFMRLSRAQLVLLSVLKEAPRPPSKLELVKWVFLASQETKLGSLPGVYEFVPYKYGPFSFSLSSDLHKLRGLGLVSGKRLMLTESGQQELAQAMACIPGAIHAALMFVIKKHSRLSVDDLLRQVYHKYPYYASRSEFGTHSIITCEAPLAVYTCGYQGLSLEGFLNTMLRQGVRFVADVRHSGWSRKYGFSADALARACPRLGLGYEHIPELGMPGDLRKNLKTSMDYEKLFSVYEATMSDQGPVIERLVQRVSQLPCALVCYESRPDHCHRSRLAERIAGATGLDIVHL